MGSDLESTPFSRSGTLTSTFRRVPEREKSVDSRSDPNQFPGGAEDLLGRSVQPSALGQLRFAAATPAKLFRQRFQQPTGIDAHPGAARDDDRSRRGGRRD